MNSKKKQEKTVREKPTKEEWDILKNYQNQKISFSIFDKLTPEQKKKLNIKI